MYFINKNLLLPLLMVSTMLSFSAQGYAGEYVTSINNQTSGIVIFAGATVNPHTTVVMRALAAVSQWETIAILQPDGSSLPIGAVVDEQKCPTHTSQGVYYCYFETVLNDKANHCYLLKSHDPANDMDFDLKVVGNSSGVSDVILMNSDGEISEVKDLSKCYRKN